MRSHSSFFSVLAVVALWGAACTESPPSPTEHTGTTSSGLFANGTPCAAGSECTSTFCVDGVCCNTACGAGVRDLQSCSNVYGKVAGLVDGTCTPLKIGDACGSLESVNPCTWRGTTVNGGNNCPNPPGGSSACYPCTSSAQCSGAFPVCFSGACVQCNGNAGSGASAACPPATPVCSAGLCVGCTPGSNLCPTTLPACDPVTSTCSTCNGDNASGATKPCPTAGQPACLPAGTCAQCSATNATACTGATPSCDATTNTCAGCNGEYGSTTATRPCPTSAAPHCAANGSCSKCAGNADCTPPLICQTTVGICGGPCSTDPECGSQQWCAAGVCIPKTANGDSLPPVAPINGTCTDANATRVCKSGTCETSDNRCGRANGTTCGPPPADATCRSAVCFPGDDKCGLPAGEPCKTEAQCRSGVCSPEGVCATCKTDTDCGGPTSGSVCDASDAKCKSGCRGTGGNGCASGFKCTSTDASIGKCVQCVKDSDCGDATSGQVCNEDNACQPGCRGSGGNACASGQPCSSQDERIGTCNACTSDADCGADRSGRVCDDAKKQCIDGCRGDGSGNRCAPGTVCTSPTAVIGTCVPGDDTGVLEGGGFSCASSPAKASGITALSLLAIAIGAATRRRRRAP